MGITIYCHPARAANVQERLPVIEETCAAMYGESHVSIKMRDRIPTDLILAVYDGYVPEAA